MAATWRVTGQTETMALDGTGRYVAGVSVAFTTGNGHSGTVFVPRASFTVDNVRQAVQAAADLADNVGNLTS